jgi:acetylornithine deacetylase/succinyl-diaminopimelate desuccinylase family protein
LSIDRTIDICAAVDALADELVASLQAAIRIPSVNPRYPGVDEAEYLGRETEVSRLVGDLYSRAGAEVDGFGLAPGRENCVGRVRGSGGGRSLVLNGHVDVVPGGPPEDWTDGDPFSGRVSGGLVFGRGACDMKGGLIAQAYAAIALREAGIELRGDLLLQAVVGEETMEHELGTTACVERGYGADAGVVCEASAPPAPLGVVVATPGVARFVVTVEGKRTHPGMRFETIRAGGAGARVGVSAIDKAIEIHAAIRRREEEWGLTKRHPLFAPGQFTIHAGVMVGAPRGNRDPFFIPDEAMLDYIVIFPPDDEPAAVREEIEELVAGAAALDGWLREHPPAIEWKHTWPPSVVASDHPLVAAACAAHEQATGSPARTVAWTAVHDGTFLNRAGIPAIAYGPGDVAVAHAADEHVRIDELVAAARTYALLAAGWCGLTTSGRDTPR